MSSQAVQLLDSDEAAALLKVSTKTLHRRVKAGLITPVILGPRLVRFNPEVVGEIARNGFPDAPVEPVRRGRPRKLTSDRRLS